VTAGLMMVVVFDAPSAHPAATCLGRDLSATYKTDYKQRRLPDTPIRHENLVHTEIHASIAVTWSKFMVTCMQHGVA
jgi:hypothetical protein